jgi:cytochrome b
MMPATDEGLWTGILVLVALVVTLCWVVFGARKDDDE